MTTASVHCQGSLAEESWDISKFMAEPVTPKDEISNNSDDIRVKMELFIMKIQVG